MTSHNCKRSCVGVDTGTAAAGDPFWLQSIEHQGIAPYNSNSSYQVFRNVQDYGAVGDGVTDDTAAINLAISDGGRCGGGTCESSTVSPAVVYFPQGTYLVSTPIQPYYYTQLIGDARVPPTILASSAFSGLAVIDADPYIDGGDGSQWFINTDNFFRSVRNFVIDLRQMPASSTATGLHWQVAQATSLMNITVEMSEASGNAHQGIWMENGSGGFIGDLVFNGGKYGIWAGNQQFTVRNVTVNNADTGIYLLWNWGWTFQDIKFNNLTTVGFDIVTGGTTEDTQTAGAETIIDAVATDVPIFLRTSTAQTDSLAGSVVLNNVQLNNVPTAVSVLDGSVVLTGGTTTISSWGQGNTYQGTGSAVYTQGTLTAPTKPSVLLDSSGNIFGKGHPQYADYSVDQFVSARSNGATGDGTTDDTAALQTLFDTYADCSIIFLDAGVYIVTSTLTIPAGTRLVGEAWSVIAGSGSAFEDASNPTVVVQVGDAGSQGVVEITDVLFTTVGPTPGAIVIEWNIAEPDGEQGGAGMWDSHIRLGGAVGTNMETAQCPAGSDNSDCMAAYMSLHLTNTSTAYLEGTWVWTADHDLDGDGTTQLTVFSGRGILSESQGPVWMIGTSEHHVLYQYNFAGAQNHYIGFIQTETPYFQPSPAVPSPFTADSALSDPSYPSSLTSAWAIYISSSSNIIIFGAGLYSFYSNYAQTCLDSVNCQSQIVNVDSASSDIWIYSLSTIAVTDMISVSESGVVSYSGNANGFADTVTFWMP
ncbi:glycoside hydrolase family 55 protein [Fistulina hepatica ATCC 64428]|nr:glycoside hydrolase family 55 protein [Fistulina hepatica ATCC 64428]